MSETFTLTEMQLGKPYMVHSFINPLSEYADKLHKMGFIHGTPVERAPVAINDPIIVMIRGTRIALRKSEASAVLVEAV